jgi:hypothetical protein
MCIDHLKFVFDPADRLDGVPYVYPTISKVTFHFYEELNDFFPKYRRKADFESLDITDVTHLRKIPLRRNKFIADINLRNIVKYMRALGLDLFYNSLLSTRDIIEISNFNNN